MKPVIILFQPYLRVHILNFGIGIKKFIFSVHTSEEHANTKTFYKTRTSSYEKEIARTKITPFHRLRRLIPLPNIRIRIEKRGDLLFTYGCLLLTNKPYCTYVENGSALFNYDPKILHNPFAKIPLIFFALQPQLKYLIFMSKTAQTSFYATAHIKEGWLKRKLEQKSIQIYPLVTEPGTIVPRRNPDQLKLLFTGVYYMKGGVETIRAFKRLRATRQELFLTVVTPLHLLSHTDKELLESTPGVTLLDAVLGKDEMTELYLTHHVFLFPTLRDTFGLVLIEALSYGLPIIALDQYAVQEMVINRYNGFLLSNHPLTDYDRDTLAMKGTLYDAKVFYQTLFAAQKSGATKPIEDFIFASVEEYILQPELLLKHSRNSLGLYRNSFHEKIIREKIDSVFLASIS